MSGRMQADIQKIVSTLAELLDVQGDHDTARLLRQSEFELEETLYDNWNGGTYTYALHFRVSSESFAELGEDVFALEERLRNRFEQMTRVYANEYLGSVMVTPSIDVSKTESTPPTEPRFWVPGELRLFISHVSEQKELASSIAEELHAYGVSGFVAHEDIEPTKEWENEIILALNTMDAFLALLTPGFETSRWTGQEIGVAIGRGVLVVPVRLGLDPYGFIGRYQALSALTKKPATIAAEAVRVLATHQLTRLRMAHGLVAAFERSDSFESARARTNRLRLATVMPQALRERVRKAVRENSQIRLAWGVPERVESILSDFQ